MKYRLLTCLAGSFLLSACAYMDGPGGRYFHVHVPVESVHAEHKTLHVTAPPGTTVIYGERVPLHAHYSYPGWPYDPYRHRRFAPRGLIRTSGGQCLDIDQGSKNGRLIAYPCHGLSSQQFVFDGRHITVNGLCLDVAGEKPYPGADVIAHACHGRANQAWYHDGRSIRSAMNGLCLDAGKTGNWVRLQRCDGSAGQQFAPD